jgi:hypothetical protein
MLDARRLLRAVKKLFGGEMGGATAEYGAAMASALASFDSDGCSSAERQLAETMAKATAALAERDRSAKSEGLKPAPYRSSESNIEHDSRQPEPERSAAAEDQKSAPYEWSKDTSQSKADQHGKKTAKPQPEPEPVSEPEHDRLIVEPREAELRAAFTRMDLHRDGQISRAEVIKALRHDAQLRSLMCLPSHIGDNERTAFERTFQEMELGSSRHFDVDAFIKFMRQHHRTYSTANTGAGVSHPRATTPPPAARAFAAAPTAKPSAVVRSDTRDAVQTRTTVSDNDLVHTQTAPPRATAATAAPAEAASASPATGPAPRAQHHVGEKGEESAVARYAREQREAKAKQEAEAKAAEEAKALALKQKCDAEEKAAAEAKVREQAALKAKLEAQRKETEAKEKAAQDAAAAQARKEQLAKEAAAAAARATAASTAQAGSIMDEEIPDEVDDYDDDSFSESVVDSPPPAVSKSKAPAAVSTRSQGGTKKPHAGAQKKPNIETDDVVEEISMESIEDDIEVDIDVSG